ncbi:MAG: chromosome condensation regulator [Harvfovirus sp.]|uniref:Chromosome condensation regulator n=1 Tax=Harvfovirus sp. TaxID=2487768 RepID=A0A3G5A100_9VIRU|nr:MAG: chromosome condensation regulator [Harvfovirus sp.]
MNIVSRIQNLPIELLSIVSNFYPRILFILPRERLVKLDWFKLIKSNFGLIYSKNECSNDEIMSVYIKKCLTKKSSIFVTNYTSSLLINGKLMRCGNSLYDGLGAGDYRDGSTKFKQLREFGNNVVEIKGTDYYTFIRLGDGTLLSCGYNSYGQLGHGDHYQRNRFTKVRGVGKNITEIICRALYTIIRLNDGTLMICGYFRCGRNVFEKIKGIGENVDKVICSDNHIIIKFTDGKLMSCGTNRYGQLGLGDFEGRTEFCEIKGVHGDIAEVACGDHFSVIRLIDGTLLSCGYNVHGQLGHGDTVDRNVFTKINGVGKNIAEIHCSAFYVIVRLTDGMLVTSNDNPTGDDRARNIFYEIKGIPKNIIELVGSSLGIIVRLTDGTLIRLGTDFSEDISPESGVYRKAFDQIKAIGKNIAEVGWSSSHTIIRFMDGTIMACGINRYGELGIGHTKNTYVFKVIKTKKITLKPKHYLMAGIMIFGALIGIKIKRR